MRLRFTKVFYRLVEATKKSRYLIFYGGSSSSKSHSVLQYLLLWSLKNGGKRITIGAESVPVLKKTVIADFRDNIMGDNWDQTRFNKSELVYTLPNKTVIQFVPGDDYFRWKGMRQDIVYFDEINHIPEEVYKQADIRTKELVISSFNPVAKFWLANTFEDDDTYVDHSTYLDNPYISPSIVSALKKRMDTDTNFTKVYLHGEWGNLEGLIFIEGKHWSTTSAFPDTYKSAIIAGDFGFSIDPTAILDVRYSDGELWVKELTYSTKLLNSDIAKIVKPYNRRTVWDSAEPKSIAELKRDGIDAYPAQKGPDSISNGIKLLKEFKINVTKDSLNLIRELRLYSYDKTREGDILPKPVDKNNHAIDALRYGAFDLFNRKNTFFI